MRILSLFRIGPNKYIAFFEPHISAGFAIPVSLEIHDDEVSELFDIKPSSTIGEARQIAFNIVTGVDTPVVEPVDGIS